MITISNIQPKPYTRFGVKYERTNSDGEYNAEVIKGKSIRIFGYSFKWVYNQQTRISDKVTMNFDRTFQIGDTVEIGSYNLTETGTIEAVSDKQITYRQYSNSTHTNRMNLYDFIRRNWDLDLVKIAEHNSNEMQYI